MNFISFTTVFSCFGNFAVFDEDNIAIINKVFDKCNISINQEPNNKANKSGKVMQIIDPLTHIGYTLRPNRLDVQLPSFTKDKKDEMLKIVEEKFKFYSTLFENCFGSRIAINTSDFCFDDNANYTLNLLSTSFDLGNAPSEVHLRVNAPFSYEDERYNCVTNIDNVGIAVNGQNNKRNSLMIGQDINTVLENNEERFDMADIMKYFTFLYNLSRERLAFYIDK